MPRALIRIGRPSTSITLLFKALHIKLHVLNVGLWRCMCMYMYMYMYMYAYRYTF